MRKKLPGLILSVTILLFAAFAEGCVSEECEEKECTKTEIEGCDVYPICQSVLKVENPMHDFKVNDEYYEYIANAGLKISIDDVSYDVGRTMITVSGHYYVTESVPFYAITLDNDNQSCVVELNSSTESDFYFTQIWNYCPGEFDLYFYKGSIPNICYGLQQKQSICLVTVTPLPYPSEDCQSIYE